MEFYCQQKCGETDFSIKDWNNAFNYCLENNLSEKETAQILEGDPCTKQCFDCYCVVRETRIKNKRKRELRKKNNG